LPDTRNTMAIPFKSKVATRVRSSGPGSRNCLLGDGSGEWLKLTPDRAAVQDPTLRR
jgi:hypothetical protein